LHDVIYAWNCIGTFIQQFSLWVRYKQFQNLGKFECQYQYLGTIDSALPKIVWDPYGYARNINKFV